MRKVLESERAEGKATMLDAPEASVQARWLVQLFMPLRATGTFGERLGFSDIYGYLKMRGYDPAQLYDWILVADAAAVEWMAERRENERKHASGAVSGGRSTRD